MSTILDALKKVERERQPARGPLLDVTEPGEHEPTPRRRVSLGVIGACAVLGFAAGVGLAIWRNTAPVEIAAVPARPATAEVPSQPDVGTAPHVVRRHGAVAGAPEERRRSKVDHPAAAPERQTATAANAAPAAPPGGGVSQPPPAAAAAEGAPERLASAKPALPVPGPAIDGTHVAGAPEATMDRAPAVRVDGAPDARAVERESALEPSPFGPHRAPSAGAPAAAQAPAAAAPEELQAPAPTEERGTGEPPAQSSAPNVADEDLGEVASREPDVALEAEEPEEHVPPPPHETFIDTGRSPTGQPKVSLSFLQWSTDPDRRFAFISIDGGPSQRVREGDTAAGLTIAAITPTGVRLKHDTTVFTITPRH